MVNNTNARAKMTSHFAVSLNPCFKSIKRPDMSDTNQRNFLFNIIIS